MNQPKSATMESVPSRNRNLTLWPASGPRLARLEPIPLLSATKAALPASGLVSSVEIVPL